ncbi:MAG: hypothetical protein JWN44_5535 [Myxococcales bacterium]|nr:hypothetical protein [Myxococcales bacterium]
MPTVFFILAAAFCDLRLSAEMVGLRVQAKLVNDGAQPLELTVGDKCAGPAFRLTVDGQSRPFSGSGKTCKKPLPVVRTILAGGVYSSLSDSLDGRKHRVVVSFGELTAAPMDLAMVVRVDLKVSATAHVAAGQKVDVEIAHLNRSAEPLTVNTCGEDRLLLDGKEQPFEVSEGCGKEPLVLKVRGAFVTRGHLTLPAGRHTLRARWRETQSDDAVVDVGN